MKGKKVHDVLNRLHLAMPTKRDEKVSMAASVGGLGEGSGLQVLGPDVPGEACVHPGRSSDA